MLYLKPMAIRRRALLFHLYVAFWLLQTGNYKCHGVESDIHCLEALKKQLKDPQGYLTSWVFNNKSEGFICKFNGIECWHPDESKVLNIRLSGLGLVGKFPLALKNCTSMTGLDLSKNNFTGSLPRDIDRIIPFVVQLDLSSNNFSGEIPRGLGNVTFLNDLNLGHNRFTGQIPEQLGRLNRLKSFSVADNNLHGQIPTSLSKFPSASFQNNNGLCGSPLNECLAPTK